MWNTIKQLFCDHDFKNVDGHDVDNKYWIIKYRCKKCGKEKREKLYYPPRCEITGKFCDNEDILDISCGYCWRYQSLNVYERHSLHKN